MLWQAPLGAIGYANPMTYRTRAGQQVVVIATGGGGAGQTSGFFVTAVRIETG